MALVIRGGEARRVRNLGWLYRHSGKVRRLTALSLPRGAGYDAVLVADCGDAVFVCNFASLDVLFDRLSTRGWVGVPVSFVDDGGRVWSGVAGSPSWAAASHSRVFPGADRYRSWVHYVWTEALPHVGGEN